LIGFRAVLGFGIGGDYPVSATTMSEDANQKNRGRMVSLVFSMQGLGLIVGPVLAIILLSSGILRPSGAGGHRTPTDSHHHVASAYRA
jgi:MFS family permease